SSTVTVPATRIRMSTASLSSNGLRLYHADLDEKARKVVDAPLADDESIAQFVEKDGGMAKWLASWRQPQKFADVRAFDGEHLCDQVAIDHQTLRSHLAIQECRENRVEGLLRGQPSVYTCDRALNHRVVGVVGGQGRRVEIVVEVLTTLKERNDFVAGHAAATLRRTCSDRDLVLHMTSSRPRRTASRTQFVSTGTSAFVHGRSHIAPVDSRGSRRRQDSTPICSLLWCCVFPILTTFT